MPVPELEDRLAALESAQQPPERNSEGWMVGLVVICATALQYFDMLTPEWVAIATALVLGYTGFRTHKKVKEVTT